MAIQVLRFEGPPGSGKSTSALSHLYQEGLRIPSDSSSGNEDVFFVEAAALVGSLDSGAEVGTPRQFVGLDDAKDAIAQATMEMTQTVKAKACIIERTRDIYAIAGKDAKAVLEYIRYSAEAEGIQFLVLEDAQPSTSETDAHAVFSSLPWLKDAPAKVMPVASPLNVSSIVARTAWAISSKVVVPFSLTRDLCDAAGWRLGPVCELVQSVATKRLHELEHGGSVASPVVSRDDIKAALCDRLAVSHAEHVAIMRGRFAKSQFAEPLCRVVARFAYDDGIWPTSETVKQAMAEDMKAAGLGDGEKPSNGAVWKAAQSMIDDRIFWLGADGKAVLRDPLLGVRLLRPELNREVEDSIRRDRASRASQAASRSM